MAAGIRRSHRDRPDNTHRVLWYLARRTSANRPEWRTATLEMLLQLYELCRVNPGISLWIRAVDGLSVFLGDNPIIRVVDLQLMQRHMLVNAPKGSTLFAAGDQLFGKASRHKGSGTRQWRITTATQVDRLIKFLRGLPKQKARRAPHGRTIPQSVKQAVFERDGGRCVVRGCGAVTDLHFDHVLPFSKGGSSLTAQNVQLMCGRHNREKAASLR